MHFQPHLYKQKIIAKGKPVLPWRRKNIPTALLTKAGFHPLLGLDRRNWRSADF
jgi:hypothetical protein